MKYFFVFFIITLNSFSYSQEQDSITNVAQELNINAFIDGTLLIPNNKQVRDLVIIIAGSGPTNRDGNQNFLKSNTLKKLAEGLASNGIASFRYDKRTVKQIKKEKIDPNTTFDDFVTDAKTVITYFKSKNQFSNIYVAGHSQGSLVGLLATENNDINGFISIAGAGQNIGDVIIEQVNTTAPQFSEDTIRIITQLKKGELTKDFPLALSSLFNIETQPFLISWMAYKPTDIISKLTIPILIINGTKDLQVSIEEAKLLANANKNTRLEFIENMNHVLFTIEGDVPENYKSYNESSRQINPQLITVIVDFIKR